MEAQDRSIASKIDLLERHDLIAEEIAEDLQATLEQFAAIAADPRERERQDYIQGKRSATLE